MDKKSKRMFLIMVTTLIVLDVFFIGIFITHADGDRCQIMGGNVELCK